MEVIVNNSRGALCQALLRTWTVRVTALSVAREQRCCSAFAGKSNVNTVAPWRLDSSPPTFLISTAEAHRRQRAPRQPSLRIFGSTQIREDEFEDGAPLLEVGDRGRPSRKVGHNALLEVE